MHLVLLYLAVVAGLFFEGEVVMISAIIAAHNGYLNLCVVLLLGILTTLSADFFYFYLGRKHGRVWIEKTNHFKDKIDKIHRWLERYPIGILLIYRFLYGLRTITPLVIGAGKIKTKTFVLYSTIGTFLWLLVFGFIGYLFGEVAERFLGHIEHIEKYLIAAILLLGLGIFIWSKVRENKNRIKTT